MTKAHKLEILDRVHIQSQQVQQALCAHVVYENDPGFRVFIDKAVGALEDAYQYAGNQLP